MTADNDTRHKTSFYNETLLSHSSQISIVIQDSLSRTEGNFFGKIKEEEEEERKPRKENMKATAHCLQS
jgi:hypothetical protein